MASAGAEKEQGEPEVVSVELPAPEGWVKKFTPKQGSAPRRSEVVFISPSGEEIKNRRQLDQYLRSHPGGPPSSSFDWGTGDTPRRSVRISEKVKISPEAEKPTQASRSRGRVKKSLEVEMTRKVSSSGLQKGTKRKKIVEDNGDEADGEALEGDSPKDGDVEDAEVSKNGKRRKAVEIDGHKLEGNSAEGDGPKDVDMDGIEDTHGIVDKESTEITKGNDGESVEPCGEIQGAIDHELADIAKENADENAEQDMELSEGRGKELELEKTLKKTLNDIGFSLAPSDSEKISLIENKGGPKEMGMKEAQEAASSEGFHSLVEDKRFNNNNENIQENVEHEVTEKARRGDNIEDPDQFSVDSTAETEEIVVEITKQTAGSQNAIKHESAIVIEETDKETGELPVEIQGESKQELADKAKENDVIEEVDGTGHNKPKEKAISEGLYGLSEPVSAVEIAIENKLAVKTDENGVEKVEQDQEQPEGRATELEPEQQGGGNNIEVMASRKDNLEQWKEHGQNQIDAEAFQPPPGYEKGVSAAKDGESSTDPIKGALTLSENCAKLGEVIDSSL